MKMRAALLALAAAAVLVPIPSRFVERFYSHGLFPVIQPLLTALSNSAPFALFDALLIAVIGAWLLLGVARRRAPPQAGLAPHGGPHAVAHRRLGLRALPRVSVRMGPELSPRSAHRAASVRRDRRDARGRALARPRQRRGAQSSVRSRTRHRVGARRHYRHDTVGRLDSGRSRDWRHGRRRPRPTQVDAPQLVLPAGSGRRHDRSVFSRDARLEPAAAVRTAVRPRARVEPSGRPRRRRRRQLRRMADVRAGARAPQQYSGWLFLYAEVSATFRGRDRARRCRRARPGPARRSRRDSRPLRARGEPAGVGGRLARVRPVSEGQPRARPAPPATRRSSGWCSGRASDPVGTRGRKSSVVGRWSRRTSTSTARVRSSNVHTCCAAA